MRTVPIDILLTYYLQSRYYDAEVGRFVNVDTLLNGRKGLDGYNLFVYCNNNPIGFSDPTGHIILIAENATEEEKGEYERAIEYLSGSKAGQDLITKLQKTDVVFTIVFVTNDKMNYNSVGKIIEFDIHSGLLLNDGASVQSPALGLAHEMGHAAQDLDGLIFETTDQDIIKAVESEVISRYETPIAMDLGEPIRKVSEVAIGTTRVKNSITYRVLTEYHSLFYYLNPFHWGKPRKIATEYN